VSDVIALTSLADLQHLASGRVELRLHALPNGRRDVHQRVQREAQHAPRSSPWCAAAWHRTARPLRGRTVLARNWANAQVHRPLSAQVATARSWPLAATRTGSTRWPTTCSSALKAEGQLPAPGDRTPYDQKWPMED